MLSNDHDENVNDENHNDIDDEEFRQQLLEYTVNDAVEHAGCGIFQFFICFIGFCCWLCDVMELSLIGYILPALEKEWGLNGVQKSLIASVLFIGMFFGSIVFGYICDRFGRRIGLIINLVYTCLAAFSSVFATNWIVFMITRALTGFGVAGIQISFSLVAEFIPMKHRATALMTMSGVGVILANIVEAGMVWLILPHDVIPIGKYSIENWRLLLIVIASPLVIVTLLSPLVPESPRFDILYGRSDRALSTIQRMVKWNRKTLPPGKLVFETSTEQRQQDVSSPIITQDRRSDDSYQNSKILALFGTEYRWITLLLSVIWFVSSFSYYGKYR
jgi:MFS family permease